MKKVTFFLVALFTIVLVASCTQTSDNQEYENLSSDEAPIDKGTPPPKNGIDKGTPPPVNG